MTNNERKNAIKIALINLANAEKALNSAYAQMREFEKNDTTNYVCDAFIMMAYAPYKKRIKECEIALSNARNEYDALTSCVAWKKLVEQVKKNLRFSC
jgi:hypothetical protein